MRTLTVRQFAAVKRVAQNVNYAVTKKNKIAEKIALLNAELETLVAEIEGHEMGIKAISGYTSEQLVTKVVEDTGKTDKDGKAIKVTKYEPRAEVVTFNETTKLYEIKDTPVEEAPVEEEPVMNDALPESYAHNSVEE